MKICIVTSGGDCAGLNACIRSIVLSAQQKGWTVQGAYNGIKGVINNQLTDFSTLPDISTGGSDLGIINKGNIKQMIKEFIPAFFKNKFDLLINIGGDGSLRIARELSKQGIPLIFIPKTIDNDLFHTQWSIGHMSAIQCVVDALDKLQTTAKTHQRVFIIEVMGRNAGHIALHAGISGNADVILIPERTYNIQDIIHHVKNKKYAMIVVAEGVKQNMQNYTQNTDSIGSYIAKHLAHNTPHDIRVNVLGHMQRGGSPVVWDRMLASALGVYATNLISQKKHNKIIGWQNFKPISYNLNSPNHQYNSHLQIDEDNVFLKTALGLGIYI